MAITLVAITIGIVVSLHRKIPDYYPGSVSFSPDGKLVACVIGWTVRHYDPRHGEMSRHGNRMRIWDASGFWASEIPCSIGEVSSLGGFLRNPGDGFGFVNDRTLAIVRVTEGTEGNSSNRAMRNCSIEYWDVPKDQKARSIPVDGDVRQLACLAHEATMCVVTDEAVTVLDGRSGNVLDRSDTARKIALSADGSRIALREGFMDEVWTIPRQKRLLQSARSVGSGIELIWQITELDADLSLSFDGAYLLTDLARDTNADPSGLRVLRVSDGEEYLDFENEEARRRASFSPTSNMLAVTSVAGIEVWDVEAKRVSAAWEVIDIPYTLTFAPDGKYLAIGFHDELSIWNAMTGQREKIVWQQPTWRIEMIICSLAYAGWLAVAVLLWWRQLGLAARKVTRFIFNREGKRNKTDRVAENIVK